MVRAIHHLDLWVTDPAQAADEWGWLLGELGWEIDVPGSSLAHPDGTYVFIERSDDQSDEPHDRLRPGLNHLALYLESSEAFEVELVVEAGSSDSP